MNDKPELHLVHNFETAFCPFCPSCGHAFPLIPEDEVWVEVPVQSEWVASYRLVIQDEEPVIAEVRLFPAGPNRRAGRWSEDPKAVPSNGVPGRALKDLKLSDPRDLFPKITKNMRRRMEPAHAAEVLDRFGLREDSRIRVRRPGRGGRDDLFYAIWAEAYVRLVEAGVPHPVKALAANPPIPVEGYVSTEGKVSVDTARGFVNEARNRKLLTRPAPGRSGGTLTDAAVELLRSREASNPRPSRRVGGDG